MDVNHDKGSIVAPTAQIEQISPISFIGQENIYDPEGLYHAIFEQSLVGIAYAALDGKFLRVNQRMNDMLGYTDKELMKRRIVDCIHPDERKTARKVFQRVVKSKAQKSVAETRYVHKDGSCIWVNVTVSLLRRPNGVPGCLLVIFEDITERKRAEEECARLRARDQAVHAGAPLAVCYKLEQSTRDTLDALLVIERERLVRERAQARVTEIALREANRRMDEFLSIASHELKSPLAAIKGNVQLVERRLRHVLQRKPLDMIVQSEWLETEIELLQLADSQVNRMDQLVSDLLDVSRIKVGKMEMSFVPCDLATIVRDALRDQQITAPKRIIRQKGPADMQAPIIADPSRIGQVVTNFLSNAIKYSPETKPIEISLRVDDHQAYVAVRDEGPGLPSRQRNLIWECFYQVDEIKEQGGTHTGLGLGLYVSKMIVEQHQGHIGVKSIPGRGATFWFTLPVKPVMTV